MSQYEHKQSCSFYQGSICDFFVSKGCIFEKGKLLLLINPCLKIQKSAAFGLYKGLFVCMANNCQLKTGKRHGKKIQMKVQSSFRCLWRWPMVLVSLGNFFVPHSNPATYRGLDHFQRLKRSNIWKNIHKLKHRHRPANAMPMPMFYFEHKPMLTSAVHYCKSIKTRSFRVHFRGWKSTLKWDHSLQQSSNWAVPGETLKRESMKYWDSEMTDYGSRNEYNELRGGEIRRAGQWGKRRWNDWVPAAR